ncbi:MAG TPA: hypothetical protein VGQ05_17590 [Streptosporangiaceae bacterium]|jgi:hypothetical protein|nr:hypothetical protein [Streptosporangiaceae bacterium]
MNDNTATHLNQVDVTKVITFTDQLLISTVDAPHDTSDVPEPLWGQLAAEFGEAELPDTLMLCGWDHAIRFAARAIRLEPESWAPAFTATAAW